jgi:hypothetical protein
MQSESFCLTIGGLTIGLAAARTPAGTRPLADRIAAAIQEQPAKSISFTVTVAPPIALSALLLVSRLIVFDAGEQEGVPPLSAAKVSARIVYSTSPGAGVEYVIAPAVNTPKRGLLAGSTSVYVAQFAFAGTPPGQSVLDTTGTLETELASAGMVSARLPMPDRFTVCNAETAASIEAEPVAVSRP